MKNSRLYLAALFIFLAGSLLFKVRTDREFINLPADEGIDAGVILRSGADYQQTFIATRPNITRLGLFFRPHQPNLPAADITVHLRQGGETLATQTVKTQFIDDEGASQLRFAPPLAVGRNQPVNIHISIPPALDGALRLQQRQPDSSFNSDNVHFTVDNQPQAAPLGYQVYSRYQPALAVQLGGLLWLGAIYLLTNNIYIYLLGAPGLFALPVFISGGPGLLVYAYSVAALAGMFRLLRREGLSRIPAFAGAHVFAFSSWWPLHLLAGREIYTAAALLPIIYLYFTNSKKLRPRLLLAAALYLTIIVFLTVPLSWPASEPGPASLRNIFLDPNQVVSAVKVDGASWDHFGSYLGAINAGLVLIGLLTFSRKRIAFAAIGLLGLLLAVMPYSPAPHFIILTTFALAAFSGFGLQALHKFLSGSHKFNLAVQIVIFLIAAYALLDLWQVSTATFEYDLL